MTSPAVSAFTQRLYDELPEFYRAADVDDGTANGKPFLRFLSLVGDQAGDVADLIDRIDPLRGPGSDLVSPDRADAAWLPWLGQLLGVVDLPPTLPEADQRTAVRGAVGGWRAGTREALATAAQSAMNAPGAYISVRDHYLGNPFLIAVGLDPATAPADLTQVIAAIEAARARPAGCKLVVSVYVVDWATLEAKYPTWGDLDKVTSWGRLEATPS